MHTNNFIKQVASLIELIEKREERIADILTRYEPYSTAQDEIERSLIALRGMEEELSRVKSPRQVGAISTFFPINLPLYSLVLFAIAPSYFTNSLYIRTSEHIASVLGELAKELKLRELFPAIQCKAYGRRSFIERCVKQSDVVLFCGRYDNALSIQKANPDALFIYNGSGINPAIVTESADLNLSVDKIIEMRTFNSGQDCAGTDCIFVDQSVYDEFANILIKKMKSLKVGSYGDKTTDIGPIVRHDYVGQVVDFINENANYIVYEGSIKDSTASPYIIKKDIKEHTGEFTELFAPVFYILTYDRMSDVVDTLYANKDYSMYISLFTEKRLDPTHFKQLTNIAQVLTNKIVNDVEYGNLAYGGYGAKANFIAHGAERIVRPILISREIDRYLQGCSRLKSEAMSITMLGSGCWEGVPAPFCRCQICRLASKNILSIENRMRPSFYVKAPNTHFIIETGPDLRLQSAKFNLPKIKDYIISHWHNDHLFGIFDLHYYAELVLEEKLNIYCSQEVAEYICQHIGYMPLNVRIVRAFESFMIGDVEVTPFPVHHMHSEDSSHNITNNVFGFSLKYAGRKVTYLADYYDIPKESLQVIQGADIAIADGTYLFEEDWPSGKLQNATREEKDPDHLHGRQIIDFTSKLSAKKIVYHSISHLPGLTHNQLQTKLPANHYIGFDGMELL